jgi:hypothetical protein
MNYIFRSNGQYLGFIHNSYLFSRDGVYLGWLEGRFVWDSSGQFRGTLTTDNKYIVKSLYTIAPVSRVPRSLPPIPPLPVPQANIVAILLPVGIVDAF